MLLVATGLLAAAAVVAVEHYGVAPRLLGPYLERRASGHNTLIESTGRIAAAYLMRADRGELTPQLEYPAWAGARADRSFIPAGREVSVGSSRQFLAAMAEARPGDVLTFRPGSYRFDGHSIEAGQPGRPQAPITVRAARLETVTLEFALLEGFHVTAPHWVFENLAIRGVCTGHDGCEHAFHITGAAQHAVIRNNDIRDFNAHIKINGANNHFPDRGRIENNTLVNSTARKTGAPVASIDLLAANGWTIEGNLIADFVKDGGDRTSYGAFAKGAAEGTRIIRNVVLCEHRLRGAPGRRIGLSFGGGGSNPPFCRDGRCVVEHDHGLMQNNLIASCSDEGVYLRRAAHSWLVHNTVLDTGGIYARYPETAAEAIRNLVDGPMRAREAARLHEDDNVTTTIAQLLFGWHPVSASFQDAGSLDLRWKRAPQALRESRPAGDAADLCGVKRPARIAYGAFDDFNECLKRTPSAEQ